MTDSNTIDDPGSPEDVRDSLEGYNYGWNSLYVSRRDFRAQQSAEEAQEEARAQRYRELFSGPQPADDATATLTELYHPGTYPFLATAWNTAAPDPSDQVLTPPEAPVGDQLSGSQELFTSLLAYPRSRPAFPSTGRFGKDEICAAYNPPRTLGSGTFGNVEKVRFRSGSLEEVARKELTVKAEDGTISTYMEEEWSNYDLLSKLNIHEHIVRVVHAYTTKGDLRSSARNRSRSPTLRDIQFVSQEYPNKLDTEANSDEARLPAKIHEKKVSLFMLAEDINARLDKSAQKAPQRSRERENLEDDDQDSLYDRQARRRQLLPPVQDWKAKKTKFYIVLAPLANEGNLKNYMSSIHAQESGPDLGQIQTLRRAIGCLIVAMAVVHAKNIFHGDIHEENVLLHNGDVYYSDFGSSIMAHVHTKSATERGRQWLHKNIAPEELCGTEADQQKMDSFGLGAVLSDIFEIIHPHISLRELESQTFSGSLLHNSLQATKLPHSDFLVGQIIHHLRKSDHSERWDLKTAVDKIIEAQNLDAERWMCAKCWERVKEGSSSLGQTSQYVDEVARQKFLSSHEYRRHNTLTEVRKNHALQQAIAPKVERSEQYIFDQSRNIFIKSSALFGREAAKSSNAVNDALGSV